MKRRSELCTDSNKYYLRFHAKKEKIEYCVV